MVSSEAVRTARRNMAIEGRYDKQELIRVGGDSNYIRKRWTPAQRRRMLKKSKGTIRH